MPAKRGNRSKRKVSNRSKVKRTVAKAKRGLSLRGPRPPPAERSSSGPTPRETASHVDRRAQMDKLPRHPRTEETPMARSKKKNANRSKVKRQSAKRARVRSLKRKRRAKRAVRK